MEFTLYDDVPFRNVNKNVTNLQQQDISHTSMDLARKSKPRKKQIASG